MTLDQQTVTLIVGFLLPVLVGLVTKYNAPNWVKIAVTGFTSIAASLIIANTTDVGTAVLSWDMIATALFQWAVTIVAYLGIYKPLDATKKMLPEQGLG